MLDFLWTLGSFIVALGILVAVHEWGHFWVARRCGVKVLKFSIGFGKSFWSKTDRQGTEYVIAAIPLGGFVRMLDSRVDDVSVADMPYAFDQQNVYKRIAIIAAGPLVNFIFAVIALYFMYLIGVESIRPVIAEIKPGSVLEQTEIQPNSHIKAIGERTVVDWESINLELVSHIGKDEMSVTVSQGGTFLETTYTVDISGWNFDPETESAIRSIGFVPFSPEITTSIGLVAEKSPADVAGLQVNDKIVELDGTPTENWEQIVQYIADRPNQVIGVMVERDGIRTPIMANIGVSERDETRGYLGVVPLREAWPKEMVFSNQYGVFGAVGAATEKTWRLITLSVEMIGKLLTGDVSVKNLSGPISIAQGAGASAGYGLVYFLSFLALISVNLGIINLLPLPVLDGGHLLYYLIELFSGKPVPESVQEIGFRIGGALLLVLMSVAIMNDIMRL
ncbi:MAG: sigma E protease regulator RseP [Alteromonadaceae bacterium]|nr:sigma E protease regulator RseP [Alteromonadaceae bacterium]